jgi:ABC-type nitrate/sulfonate/bicarbonate transport system substrate-binding protein
MKRWRIVIILLSLAVCAVIGFVVLWHWPSGEKYSGPALQVTIGTALIDQSGLIWIAEHRGYFTGNGVNVTIKLFPAGKHAMGALLSSEVDVATASEFVFVVNALRDENIQILGSICKGDGHYLVTKKDGSIRKPVDLKGKRIGIPLQTTAEFYLGRYLQLNGINLSDVTAIDIQPTQLGEALIKGEVDAVLVWDPYAYLIEKNLSGNSVIKPAQGGQPWHWLLVARNDYVTKHTELIDRLLRSLYQAERFAIDSPVKARRIVQERLKIDDVYMERAWANIGLGLSLDQGLIIAMEDQSRWRIGRDRESNLRMPYYPSHVYWQSLEKVNPLSVTMIR